MNEDLANYWPEHLVRWFQGAEYLSYVVSGVIILFYQLPAYRRFRTRALLFCVIAEALGLFITIFDRTIAQDPSIQPQHWWNYYLLREVGWFVSVILGTIGVLWFLRDYTRLATAAAGDASKNSPSS